MTAASSYLQRALADPLYADLIDVYGTGSLGIGGYFEHEMVSGDELTVTPTGKVRANHEPGTRNAVLLLTGALAPVHDGHLGLLEAARTELERRGINVCAGYLSPGHDGYVSTKPHGAAAYGAARRVRSCQERTEASDWLETCPWEALYTPFAVNFSEVIRHLERVAAEIDPAIEVWFVFGSDNAGFTRAFARRGRCVCGGRGDIAKTVCEDPLLADRDDIVFLSPSPHAAESSTSIRRSARRPRQAPGARGEWYGLRDDRDWIAATWPGLDGPLREFSERVRAILAVAVGSPAVELMDPSDSRSALGELERRAGRVISLDPLAGGSETLAVSRVFEPAGAQMAARGIVARPGSSPLADQVAALTPGSCLLADDDRASGLTVEAVSALLGDAGIEVRGFEALGAAGVERRRPPLDVVDLRDFLLGAPAGGLVVDLGESIARAPYLPPYVDLTSRAKLPAEEALTAGLELWTANLRFHQQSGLRVDDGCPQGAGFFAALPFGATASMAEVCEWHLERLQGGGQVSACAALDLEGAHSDPAR